MCVYRKVRGLRVGPARRLLAGLLGEEDGVDVRKDTTRSDGDSAKELVEFLVVLDGEGNVPGDNPGLLVVTGGVSGELENLSAEVLKDSSKLHKRSMKSKATS